MRQGNVQDIKPEGRTLRPSELRAMISAKAEELQGAARAGVIKSDLRSRLDTIGKLVEQLP